MIHDQDVVDALHKLRDMDDIISLQSVDAFLRQEAGYSRSPGRVTRSGSLILASALVITAVFTVLFLFLRHDSGVAPEGQTMTTGPDPSMGVPVDSSVQDKRQELHDATPSRSLGQKMTSSPIASVTSPNTRPPVAIPIIAVAWAPKEIAPMRVYLLTDSELAMIGLFIYNDGMILRTWGGRFSGEKALGDGAVEYNSGPRSGNRIMNSDSTWARCMRSLQRKLEITFVVETDASGRVYQYVPAFFGISSDSNGYSSRSLSETGFVGPDLTKNAPSSSSETYADFCLDNLDPRLQTLIPIMIQTKIMTRIYWLQPTPDLRMNLPEWMQNDLRDREEQRHMRKSSGPGKNKDFDLRFTLRSGDSPDENPHVEMELNERRELGMALYTIEGQRVKELTPFQRYDRGDWKQEIDVKDVSRGIYLFTIISPEKEQIVQRICIP